MDAQVRFLRILLCYVYVDLDTKAEQSDSGEVFSSGSSQSLTAMACYLVKYKCWYLRRRPQSMLDAM